MKQNKVAGGPFLRSQRVLLALIVLAALLFVLALSSAGKPVYAASPTASTPQQIVTGGGGGGPTNEIQGQIFNADGPYAAGVTVCLYDYAGGFIGSCSTDSQGNYVFSSPQILANSEYLVTVNGNIYDLGFSAIDPAWSQYSCYWWTNSVAYAVVGRILLEPAAVVYVPSAAMYSDTKYATIEYTTQQTNTYSHTLTFNIAGNGISYGYTSSLTASSTLTTPPNFCYYMGQECLAGTWFADTQFSGVNGIEAAGIEKAVQGIGPVEIPTSEYLNWTDPRITSANSEIFNVLNGSDRQETFTETGSRTWSASAGVDFSVSFGVVFVSYGVQITIDTTATTTASITNQVTIDLNRSMDGPNTPPSIDFLVFTVGAPFTTDSSGLLTGGLEVHVWDIDRDG